MAKYIILGLLVFIIVLCIIVTIHEGGHFLAAKKAGILCHEFSIGMGPKIASKKKGETVYSIRCIPIGGFVAMAGEEINSDPLQGIKKIKFVLESNRVTCIIASLDNPKYSNLPVYELLEHDIIGSSKCLDDELFITVRKEGTEEVERYVVDRCAMFNYQKKDEIQIAPYDRTFANKPLKNRFLSVFAGPFMNFVLAIVVFFISGLIFGYVDTSTTVVKNVEGSALLAGIENNDTILSIGDQKLSDWNSLSDALSNVSLTNNLLNNGSVKVTYLDNSDNLEKETYCYPTIIIYSLVMIVDTNEEGQVIVNSFQKEDNLLKANDIILKVDETPVNNVVDLVKYMSAIENSTEVKLTIKRDGEFESKDFKIKTYSKDMLDTQDIPLVKGVLGVSTGYTKNIGKLFYMPFVETGEASLQIFKTLGLFFKKSSGVKITDLSGPVGIFNLFTQLVQGEDAFANVLRWTGLLSVNIGLINLLPFPALDGGRLAFIIYEAITKKRPNAKVENIIHNVGFFILMGLFVFVAISDVIKCF